MISGRASLESGGKVLIEDADVDHSEIRFIRQSDDSSHTASCLFRLKMRLYEPGEVSSYKIPNDKNRIYWSSQFTNGVA